MNIDFLKYTFALTLLIFPIHAHSCDPCALYSATGTEGLAPGSVRLGIAEDYTRYDESDEIPDNSIRDGEIVRGYSTTQLAVSYDVTKNFGVQTTLPFVARRYEDIERFRRRKRDEAGIGDAVLSAYYMPIGERDGERALLWNIYGGIKFPTGDTGSIERSLGDEERKIAGSGKHHSLSGGLGGKVLSLGSGSFDFPLGTSLFLQKGRTFSLGTIQYTFRTEGDFEYRFDNDLVWDFGPGYFVYAEHDFSLAPRLVLSGEHKGRDQFNGESVEGSESNNFFLGPQILFTASGRISGEVGIDGTVYSDDSDATVVPAYRLRSAISYRF